MWSPFGHQGIDEPWEVVDSKSVEPVPMFEEHDPDLDIVRVSHSDLVASRVFDITPPHGHSSGHKFDLEAALHTARTHLLREAARIGYNVLLLEGWSITLLRKRPRDPAHIPLFRIAVRYTARPGSARTPPPLPPPPFLDLLRYWGEQAKAAYASRAVSGKAREARREEAVRVRVKRSWSWSGYGRKESVQSAKEREVRVRASRSVDGHARARVLAGGGGRAGAGAGAGAGGRTEAEK